MRLSQSDSVRPYSSTGIHPLPGRFADEVGGTAARLFAYVGFLALLAIGALWPRLPPVEIVTLADDPDGAEGAASKCRRPVQRIPS